VPAITYVSEARSFRPGAAIDLDGSSWQADAPAIPTISRLLDLEPAIERSRSGNGAHLWFLFAEAIPSADARKLLHAPYADNGQWAALGRRSGRRSIVGATGDAIVGDTGRNVPDSGER
jgi:TOTE conflict system, Archaeo-Eukaryotic Primase domain